MTLSSGFTDNVVVIVFAVKKLDVLDKYIFKFPAVAAEFAILRTICVVLAFDSMVTFSCGHAKSTREGRWIVWSSSL